MVRTLCRVVAMGLLMGGLLLAPNAGMSEERLSSADRMWRQLLQRGSCAGSSNEISQGGPTELHSV